MLHGGRAASCLRIKRFIDKALNLRYNYQKGVPDKREKIEMLDFEKNKQLLKNITTATIKAKIKRRHYYERIKI